MKKLFLVCAMFVCFAALAVAEIALSASGRMMLIPFAYRTTDDASYFGAEAPWGGDGPDLKLGFTGSVKSGMAGLNLTMGLQALQKAARAGNAASVVDDNAANVWLMPFKTESGGGIFDSLKFTLGIFNVDPLRFKYGGSGSGFHNYVAYMRGDPEDQQYAFQRFRSNGFGSHIEWTYNNLYIGAAFGSSRDSRSFQDMQEDGWINVMKDAQFGVGYTIPDIVFIRAQWVGYVEYDDTVPESPLAGQNGGKAIQFAVNVKAIKDVDIDVGLSVPLRRDLKPDAALSEVTKEFQSPYIASVGVDVNFRPLRFYIVGTSRIGEYTQVNGGDKVKAGTVFNAFITPMYYLPNNLILMADIFFDARVGSDANAIAVYSNSSGDYIGTDGWKCDPDPGAKNNYFDLGFGVYIRKNFGGGDIRAGVTLKVPGGEAHENAGVGLFFPIMFNYSL